MISVPTIEAIINSSKCMEEEIDIYARSMHVITNCVGVGRLVLASSSQEPTPHDSKVILVHSVHTFFDTLTNKNTKI